MTTNTTCPHCGAETDTLQPNLYYLCGSIKGMPEHQTLKCFRRQVAQQTAEIERLKALELKVEDVLQQAILNEREACVEVCKRLSKGRGCFVEEVLNEAVEAIKARGET